MAIPPWDRISDLEFPSPAKFNIDIFADSRSTFSGFFRSDLTFGGFGDLRAPCLRGSALREAGRGAASAKDLRGAGLGRPPLHPQALVSARSEDLTPAGLVGSVLRGPCVRCPPLRVQGLVAPTLVSLAFIEDLRGAGLGRRDLRVSKGLQGKSLFPLRGAGLRGVWILDSSEFHLAALTPAGLPCSHLILGLRPAGLGRTVTDGIARVLQG